MVAILTLEYIIMAFTTKCVLLTAKIFTNAKPGLENLKIVK